MIEGLRRKLGTSMDEEEKWDANMEFKPDPTETAEISTDTAVLVAATHATGEYTPSDSNTPDYYKTLVSTAIENGGKYGEHQISIPWLRMILAGLEFRQVEPESMWYGVEAGAAGTEPLPEIPSYEDLFPSDRDRPSQPYPN